MIVTGPTLPHGSPREGGTLARAPSGAPPRKGFAGLLGDPQLPGTSGAAPAYNRLENGEHAVSFMGMPLVGPVAIDLPEPAAGAKMSAAAMPAEPVPAGDIAPTGGGAAPVLLAASEPVSGRGAGALSGHMAQAGAALPHAAASGPASPASVQPWRTADPVTETGDMPAVRSRGAPPRMASQPLVLALGAGITVHLVADEAHSRVTVRGGRIAAGERDAVMERIARLMRGHGFAISKQAIDFEEGAK